MPTVTSVAGEPDDENWGGDQFQKRAPVRLSD
jgi:hypothetical protein